MEHRTALREEPRPDAVTNADLSERIDALEAKIDLLYNKMNQTVGAWTALKVLGSLLLGVAVIVNAANILYDAFHR